MIENIIPLAVFSGVTVSVIAGLILHNAKKEYVEQAEFEKSNDKFDARINSLEKTTTTLERDFESVKNSVSEIKYEVKETKTLIQEMNAGMIRMTARFEEYLKIKNNLSEMKG